MEYNNATCAQFVCTALDVSGHPEIPRGIAHKKTMPPGITVTEI